MKTLAEAPYVGALAVPAPWPGRVLGHLLNPKALAAASILAVWWVGSVALPADIVPAPKDVAIAMGKLVVAGDALFHLRQTVSRILLGFGVSVVLALGVGLLMGVGRRLSQYVELWITVIITIPSLCWAIIALAWFGLRTSAAIFTIVAITFPPMAVNFWTGVKEVDVGLIEMARTFRARRALIIRRVVIPQLVPYAIAATRYGLPLAWKMAIITEMMGLSDGVGYQLVYWFHVLDMTQVFAWMLLFTAVMLVVEYVVIKPLERRCLGWKSSATTL
jgi:NitT/TauT family transport system permease protein